MFRPVDWPMFGLKASMANLAPTGGAAQPLRDMGEIFPRWAARPRRRLTLGLTCSLHGGAARGLLGAYRKAHPDVDLVIEDLDDVSVRAELDGRHIDAAIAADRSAKPGWRHAPLWSDRLVAVLLESHPLASGATVPPRSLREEILLLAGDGSGDKSLRAAICDALGGPPASFMHHLVERDTLFDLVALGLGVTVCPASTLGAFYPAVCARLIDSPTAELNYSLMWRADARNDALADLVALAGTYAPEEQRHGLADPGEAGARKYVVAPWLNGWRVLLDDAREGDFTDLETAIAHACGPRPPARLYRRRRHRGGRGAGQRAALLHAGPGSPRARPPPAAGRDTGSRLMRSSEIDPNLSPYDRVMTRRRRKQWREAIVALIVLMALLAIGIYRQQADGAPSHAEAPSPWLQST